MYLQALSVAAQSTEAAPLHSLFDRALQIDPEFALAHAQKAALYADSLVNTVEGIAVDPQERAEMQRLARRHADKALELDPTCGEAYASAAGVDLVTWRWREALDRFEKFSRWDTGRLLFSVGRQAWLLAYAGNIDEAVSLCSAKNTVTRNDWAGKFVLGTVYGYARQYDSAIEYLESAARLAPGIPIIRTWTAILEAAQGNAAAALTEVRIAERLMGTQRALVYLPELALTYGRLGADQDVQRLGAEIRALAAGREIGEGTWAMLYLAEDEQPKALEHLEKLVEKVLRHEVDQGFFNAMNLKMNIWADPRLEQPEFKKVMARVTGLAG